MVPGNFAAAGGVADDADVAGGGDGIDDDVFEHDAVAAADADSPIAMRNRSSSCRSDPQQQRVCCTLSAFADGAELAFLLRTRWCYLHLNWISPRSCYEACESV